MSIKSFKNHRVILVHEGNVDAYRAALELSQRMIQHDLDTDPDMAGEERTERITAKADLQDLIVALERSI